MRVIAIEMPLGVGLSIGRAFGNDKDEEGKEVKSTADQEDPGE